MIRLEPFTNKDFDQFISWITDEELLVTIAGSVFSFPVTHEQLEKYVADPNSSAFVVVDTDTSNSIGHAELLRVDEKMFKIDKLLIGDRSLRGQGIGQQLMEALVEYAFVNLDAAIIELNVFDWNSGAIRCYEKTGFINNPAKSAIYRVGNNEWLAVNMFIRKEDWL